MFQKAEIKTDFLRLITLFFTLFSVLTLFSNFYQLNVPTQMLTASSIVMIIDYHRHFELKPVSPIST